MKIQNYAVVFIVIIMPIALVLSVYTGNLIGVANRQASYDSILLNSTYDAISAYQMNTLNNDYESETNSKVRDINASINSFFNSLGIGFSSSGLGKNELTEYIPAILYTLYDGYYVYGTFDNIVDTAGGVNYNSDANVNKKEYGLKPYVYYSCEYAGTTKDGKKYDIVVNYSLDNYITVTGTYGDTYISRSGYYINFKKIDVGIKNGKEPADFDNKTVTIRKGTNADSEVNVVIKPEILGEYLTTIDTKRERSNPTRTFYSLSQDGGKARYYRYIIYNNIKYYLDNEIVGNDGTVLRGVDRENEINYSHNMSYDGIPIFYLDKDTRTYISQSTLNELKDYLGVYVNNADGTRNVEAENRKIYSGECFKDVNAYYYYYNSTQFSQDVYDALKDIDLGKTDVTDSKTGEKYSVIISNLPYDKNGRIVDVNGTEHTGNVIKTETYHTKYTYQNGVESHVKSTYDTSKVFNFDNEDNNPELESSSFNRHRMDVIISSIESSLVSAMANFDDYIGGTYDYNMPVLLESEWEEICNNMTMASFMQGLTIGNYKYYSNYAIVANTKVKDFISKDSIYIQKASTDEAYNGEYHNPRCTELNSEINKNYANNQKTELVGYRNIDYDRQNCILPNQDGSTHEEYWYYLQPGTGAYECVVGQNDNTYTTDDLLSGKKSEINQEIRRAYITALAREKGNSYKSYGFLNEELQAKTTLKQGEMSYNVHYFYQDYDSNSNSAKSTYTETNNTYTYSGLIGAKITELNINRTPSTGYKYSGDSQIKIYDYAQNKYVLLNDSNNRLQENTRTDIAVYFNIDLNQGKQLYYDVEYYLWDVSTAKYNFVEKLRTQVTRWVNSGNSLNVSIPSTYRGATLVYTNPEGYMNSTKSISLGETIKAYYSTQPEFTGKSYTVRYYPNGGSGSMGNTSYNFFESNTLNQNSFTKEGNKFEGWALSPDGDVVYSDSGIITRIDGSNMSKEGNEYYLELYAKWSGISYQVSYQPNGATSGNMQNSTHKYNEYSNLNKNEFKKEYKVTLNLGPCETNFYDGTFSSWLNSANITFDDTTGEFSMNVNSSTTKQSGLYYTGKNAVLKSGKTATISYEVYSNRKVTLGLKVQNSLVGATQGNSRVDGNSNLDTVEVPANQWTTIYFSYKNNNKSSIYDYSVLYVQDSDTPVNLKIKNPRFEVVNGKTKIENQKEIITIEDKFLKWTYSGKDYQDGQEIYNLTSKDGEVVPMTAKWDKALLYLPEINQNGYKFKGWVDSNGNKLNPDTPVEVEEDIVINAEWDDDIPPEVEVTVLNTTSNSITVQTVATDKGSGLLDTLMYTYFIREKGTNEWKQFDGLSMSEYTFENLKNDTTYEIKVNVKADLSGNVGTGNATGKTRQITGKIYVKSQTWYTTDGNNIRQMVQFAKRDYTDEGLWIETSIDNTNVWNSTDTVYNLTHGQTVYARLTDGTNYVDQASALVYDGIKPTIVTTIPYYNEIEMSATDEGVGIVGYLATKTPQVPSPNEFTSCNASSYISTTITGLSGNTTYYLWVIDGAGNISNYASVKTLDEVYSVYYFIDTGNYKELTLRKGDNCLNPSFATPSKNGYRFVGWRETIDADKNVLTTKKVENHEVYLYAVFEKDIILTCYNNSSTNPTVQSGIQIYNNGVIKNPKFTIYQANRNGWQQRGWSQLQDGNAAIKYSDIVDRTFNTSETLYGLYQKQVSVYYNGNGNTSGSMTSSSSYAYYNSSGRTVNASINLKSNEYTRFNKSVLGQQETIKENATWLGWAEGNLSGDIKSAGFTYSGIDDITYYAKWKQKIYLYGDISVSARYTQFYDRGYFWSDHNNPNNTDPAANSEPCHGYIINDPVNYNGNQWYGAYPYIITFKNSMRNRSTK